MTHLIQAESEGIMPKGSSLVKPRKDHDLAGVTSASFRNPRVDG
jgi:hypothetical protein